MQLLSPNNFRDYELLDCGDFEKLERFGSFITIRPEPQALWPRALSEKEWKQQAHVRFIQSGSASGSWQKLRPMPDKWRIAYVLDTGSKAEKTICFRLSLTAFKHVGIFPEQAVNWDYIYRSLAAMKNKVRRVLNLFAYTGGASLAARAAGADVTHVDSVKQVLGWAHENMELSGLNNIRWVLEDALKFVKREVKRGKKYNGIILDPPAYGHGPSGEKWKLEEQLSDMMSHILQLLDEEEHFLILNAYSLGLSSLVIENLLHTRQQKATGFETGELFLRSKSGFNLPLGVFGRFVKKS